MIELKDLSNKFMNDNDGVEVVSWKEKNIGEMIEGVDWERGSISSAT